MVPEVPGGVRAGGSFLLFEELGQELLALGDLLVGPAIAELFGYGHSELSLASAASSRANVEEFGLFEACEDVG